MNSVALSPPLDHPAADPNERDAHAIRVDVRELGDVVGDGSVVEEPGLRDRGVEGVGDGVAHEYSCAATWSR